MTFRKLLIANRGEIAIRIARAAATIGFPRWPSTPKTMQTRCTLYAPMKLYLCPAQARAHISTVRPSSPLHAPSVQMRFTLAMAS